MVFQVYHINIHYLNQNLLFLNFFLNQIKDFLVLNHDDIFFVYVNTRDHLLIAGKFCKLQLLVNDALIRYNRIIHLHYNIRLLYIWMYLCLILNIDGLCSDDEVFFEYLFLFLFLFYPFFLLFDFWAIFLWRLFRLLVYEYPCKLY